MSAKHTALQLLERACLACPDNPDVWLALSREYVNQSAFAKAAKAHRKHELLLGRCEPFVTIQKHLAIGDLQVAQHHLRSVLSREPTHCVALRLLANIALKTGRYEHAKRLLLKCLALSPAFLNARLDLAVTHFWLRDYRQAIAFARPLLIKHKAARFWLGKMLISCLSAVGDFEEARTYCEQLTTVFPDRIEIWLRFAGILSILGQLQKSVKAYHKCIEIDPGNSVAYWHLANLKAYSFSDPEISEIQYRISVDGAPEDMARFHFALGKALEDKGINDGAMQSYLTGNRIQRSLIGYSTAATESRILAVKSTFSGDFFRARQHWGCNRPDPIFIVSLPRSGSTLVEQILSSHSQVEATMELDEIDRLLDGIAPRGTSMSSRWARICKLSPAECAELGREYVARTQVYRKSKKPYFIDKMPGNYVYVGFIHLILPNAKLIEVRREPLSACVANFLHLFGGGNYCSYDLAELGHFYSSYRSLMDHFADALPEKIHYVSYERIVTDTELEVRNLLRYCNLQFEPACLRFHENKRYVNTPSSHQVRRPIYHDGLSRWQKFDEWLTPLRSALVVDTRGAGSTAHLRNDAGMLD